MANLTNDQKELIINSKRIIEEKEDITSLDESKGGYVESIKDAFKKDNINRIEFLKKNSIVAGLTLEFRNIYGIEAPFYDINRNKHISMASSTGTGLNASGEQVKNDITGRMEYPIRVPDVNGELSTTFADCQELINAAYFDNDTKDVTDKMLFADKQRFFVDSKKAQESSSFYEPFCPPGLNKWSGSFLHENICKNFDTTELDLYNMLNGASSLKSKIETLYSDTLEGSLSFIAKAVKSILGIFGIKPKSSYFSADNPIVSNTDSSGRITRHNFQYNITDEELEAYKSVGAMSYDIKNGGTDVSPTIYYSTSKNVEQNCLVSYKLVEKGNKESNSFCNGYAILTRHPETPNAFSFNIITQNGDLYKPSTTENHTFLIKKWSWTTTNTHPYSAYFSPTAITSPDAIKSILKYYKSMLSEVVYYYDYYITVVKGGCKIDIEKSYKSMIAIINAINAYENNSTDANLRTVKDAIKSRLETIVYDGTVSNPSLPSKRAKEIDDYLRNSPDFFSNLFFAVQQRIDKRTGTMREVYRLITNSAIAFSATDSKKERLLNSLNNLNSFSIKSGFGTRKITIQLEPWEDCASFNGSITKNSVVNIICDDSVTVLGGTTPIITAVVNDVEHTMFKQEEIVTDEYGDEKKVVTQRDGYQITLSRKVPESFKELNPRIVKKVVGIPALKNVMKGYVENAS